MKIATWNINSIRLRLPLLKKLLLEESISIICLQEIKAQDHFFPVKELEKIGYQLYFRGEKSYNGVAILVKALDELKIQDVFHLNLYNNDARHIAVKVNNIEVHNFYVPAGGDIPDPELNNKFRHKLAYIDLIYDWLQKNRCSNDALVIAGDLNIAPYEHDVWSSKQLRNVVSHTDIERKKLLELQQSFNFIDSARYFTPLSQKSYTWWSYRNQNWRSSNRGRRLDHIWVTPVLQNQLLSSHTLVDARDWPMPSDHVPYIITLNC